MAFTQIAEIWSEKLIMGYSLKHNKYESIMKKKEMAESLKWNLQFCIEWGKQQSTVKLINRTNMDANTCICLNMSVNAYKCFANIPIVFSRFERGMKAKWNEMNTFLESSLFTL